VFVLQFLIALCGIALEYSELFLLYKIVYILFMALVCEYKYGFAFICFCYGKYIFC
jgi:hypothetical protein